MINIIGWILLVISLSVVSINRMLAHIAHCVYLTTSVADFNTTYSIFIDKTSLAINIICILISIVMIIRPLIKK